MFCCSVVGEDKQVSVMSVWQDSVIMNATYTDLLYKNSLSLFYAFRIFSL